MPRPSDSNFMTEFISVPPPQQQQQQQQQQLMAPPPPPLTAAAKSGVRAKKEKHCPKWKRRRSPATLKVPSSGRNAGNGHANSHKSDVAATAAAPAAAATAAAATAATPRPPPRENIEMDSVGASATSGAMPPLPPPRPSSSSEATRSGGPPASPRWVEAPTTMRAMETSFCSDEDHNSLLSAASLITTPSLTKKRISDVSGCGSGGAGGWAPPTPNGSPPGARSKSLSPSSSIPTAAAPAAAHSVAATTGPSATASPPKESSERESLLGVPQLAEPTTKQQSKSHRDLTGQTNSIGGLSCLSAASSPAAAGAGGDRARRRHVQTVNERRPRFEDNLAAIFMGFVLVFLVCHTPRLLLNIHELATIREAMQCEQAGKNGFPLWSLILISVSHLLLVLNSSINILIYCLLSSKFREECRLLFRRAFGVSATQATTTAAAAAVSTAAVASAAPVGAEPPTAAAPTAASVAVAVVDGQQ